MSPEDYVSSAKADIDAAITLATQQAFLTIEQRLEFAKAQALVVLAEATIPTKRKGLRKLLRR